MLAVFYFIYIFFWLEEEKGNFMFFLAQQIDDKLFSYVVSFSYFIAICLTMQKISLQRGFFYLLDYEVSQERNLKFIAVSFLHNKFSL